MGWLRLRAVLEEPAAGFLRCGGGRSSCAPVLHLLGRGSTAHAWIMNAAYDVRTNTD